MPTIGIYELHSIPIANADLEKQNILSVFCQILIYLQSEESFKNHFLIFKKICDGIVFDIYFEEHMKEKQIDIIALTSQEIEKVMQGMEFMKLDDASKNSIIKTLYDKWTHPDNEVRNRVKLFTVRSPDILKPILES